MRRISFFLPFSMLNVVYVSPAVEQDGAESALCSNMLELLLEFLWSKMFSAPSDRKALFWKLALFVNRSSQVRYIKTLTNWLCFSIYWWKNWPKVQVKRRFSCWQVQNSVSYHVYFLRTKYVHSVKNESGIRRFR